MKKGKPKLKLRVINYVVNGKNKKKAFGDLSAEERQYFRDLNKVVDEIFAEAASQFEWTWNQLAENSGLSCQTVMNLGDRKTKYPRFMTIYRLAKAIGWELVVQNVKPARKNMKKAS